MPTAALIALLVLLNLATTGCGQEPAATKSSAPQTNPADYRRYRDEGDARLAAGSKAEALALFEKARAADPGQLGIHDRLARLSLALGDQQRGLAAIAAMLRLDPQLKQDADITGLEQRLQALGTKAPATNSFSATLVATAAVPSTVALATRTAELAIKEAAAAYSQGQAELARQLGNEAREALLPILQAEGANHVPAWEAAARAALLVQENYLAAAALVNLERLEPNYAQTPRLLDLMAELNRRPIQGLLAEARAQPAEFLKSFAGKPRAGSAFVNSLGQKFVPVPGTGVQFCVWETRVKDYAAYAQANPSVDASWKDPTFVNVAVTPTDDCPVVNVSWEDAKKFCEWLTRQEQRDGRLSPPQYYRLPTDMEWSRAVGLPSESGSNPRERDTKIKDIYPWGSQWPPPAGAGNYADQTAKTQFNNLPVIDSYRDGFATTAPVGSFAANQFGLFDLGGNVWEWCDEWWDGEQKYRVLRGGSWNRNDPGRLLSSYRYHYPPEDRDVDCGFRVVLVSVR